MSKIKLCIFDMDGLLLDTERYAWSISQKEIIKEYGKEISDELIRKLIGSDNKLYIKIIQDEYGKDFPANEYSKKVRKRYAEICKNNIIPLRPGVIELLNFLKENKILISLGTSTEKEYAEIALKKSGIKDYFDFAVFGDQVQLGKPNPEVYLKSVNHFKLQPNECVVFEDTPIGASAAYNANIKLILVPDLKQPTNLDRKKAFAIINSLQEAIPIIKKENNII